MRDDAPEYLSRNLIWQESVSLVQGIMLLRDQLLETKGTQDWIIGALNYLLAQASKLPPELMIHMNEVKAWPES